MSEETVDKSNDDVENPLPTSSEEEVSPSTTAPARPSNSSRESRSSRKSVAFATPTYREAWVTILLTIIQAGVIALLATSTAGIPEANNIDDESTTFNKLSHFDYQTVGIYTESKSEGSSYATTYEMMFSLKFAGSKITLEKDGSTSLYEVYQTFQFQPCNTQTQTVTNTFDNSNEITEFNAETDLCKYPDLATTCHKWGESAGGYFATAFVISAGNLVLILGQALTIDFPLCGPHFRVMFNWLSLIIHALSFIFVSATYGFSTNCVGGWSEIVAGTNLVKYNSMKVNFKTGEVYGVAGTAIALLVLQMLLCVYFRYPENAKAGAERPSAARRETGIAPPAPAPAPAPAPEA